VGWMNALGVRRRNDNRDEIHSLIFSHLGMRSSGGSRTVEDLDGKLGRKCQAMLG
jgi:hypothetical protein